MGMAASQARLLCITARIHDVEYQAQSIQHAKLQLANQSDEVYEEYIEALGATTLTVDAWGTGKVTASFNNLFSSNRIETSNGDKYALIDSRGRLVVEDDVYNKYNEFQTGTSSTDPYDFAMFMFGVDPDEQKLAEAEDAVFNKLTENGENKDHILALKKDSLIEMANAVAPDEETIVTLDDAQRIMLEHGDTEQKKKFREAYDTYRYELYRRGAGEIYKIASNQEDSYNPEENFPLDKFEYYADIYKQILSCGGCTKISDYNGTKSGDAANNSEWLQAMIQSGKMTISTYKIDTATGEVVMNGTSPSSDSVLSYTPTSEIDKTAVAKAEAKYEHDMRQIDQKEKEHDMTLTKLETEREALTQELQSVEKVIKENIERTYNIFS